MCLSPEVDLAVGLVLTAVTVDSLRHSTHSRTLGMALIPAIFAVHSFSSAVVWLSEMDLVGAGAANLSTWLYLFIAFVLLPIYVPLAVLLIEPMGWRRTALFTLSGLGLISGMESMFYLMNGAGSVVEQNNSLLDFHISGTPTHVGIFYMLATCGAMFLSAQRILIYWAFFNAAAIAVLMMRARDELPSLWCLWAAATSIFVAWFLRRLNRDHKNGALWPWELRPWEQQG